MAGHDIWSYLAAVNGASKNRCCGLRSNGASQLSKQLSFCQLDAVRNLIIFGMSRGDRWLATISQADTSQAAIGLDGHQPYLKNYYLPPVTG